MFRAKKIYEHQTNAVFALKSMVGWGEHKVVLGESGFRAYCVDVHWDLNFLSVAGAQLAVAYQVVQQNLETWLARRSAGGLDAGAGLVQ